MSTLPVAPGQFKPTEHRPALKREFSTRTKIKHMLKRVARGFEAVAPMVLPILPHRGVIAEALVGTRTLRCYQHWPDDAAMLAAWDRLAMSVPDGMVFQSPHWQQGATVIPDAMGTLRVVTVHDGGRLVAAVPFERTWSGHWQTANEVSTAYHDPLIHPENADATADALLRGLPMLDPAMTSVEFQLLSPSCNWLRTLPPIAAAAGYTAEKEFVTTDTVVPLAATWDKYLESLPGHHRRELRRMMRKLEESGKCRFVVNDTEETVVARLPHTLQLMANDKGGKSRKTRWMYRRHLMTSAPALARTGRMVVYELFIDGHLAAGSIGLPQNNHQLMFNGAFDPAFYQWSPGIVLWGMNFRNAIQHGQTSIDLLRGLPPYKQSLGAVELPMHRLILRR